MECIINDTRVRFEDGKLYTYIKYGRSKTYNWFLMKQPKALTDDGNGTIPNYITICINQKKYRLHRVIYKVHNPEWDINDSSLDNAVDHIDRNRLNNNIENLRIVSQQENLWNQKGRGCWQVANGKWRSVITLNRKRIYLGYYDTQEEAHKNYVEAKSKYHNIILT